MAEVIWGDGEKVQRHRIDWTGSEPFIQGVHGEELLPLKMPGAKWVRLEAWDIAANGAFTQPVWIK